MVLNRLMRSKPCSHDIDMCSGQNGKKQRTIDLDRFTSTRHITRFHRKCDNIIQLMTFHKVDTVIYQPRGSDVHRSQRLR